MHSNDRAVRALRRKLKKAVKKSLGIESGRPCDINKALETRGHYRVSTCETRERYYARYLRLDYNVELALLRESQPTVVVKLKPKPAPRKKKVSFGQKIGAPHPDYVRDDGFYETREWREIRYLALRNTDGRCQACGGSAKDGLRIHVDHIIPRYKRPDLSLCLDNLQVLCEDCNFGKGAWDQTDWR